jgi:hypothetical protein
VQQDRDVLWTSPIWVNGPGADLPTDPPLVKIADLRVNYGNGFPANLLAQCAHSRRGDGGHTGVQGPGYLQDSTAGISVFGPEFCQLCGAKHRPPRAFEVEVHGVVDFFNGLTQMLVYSIRRTGLVTPPAPVALQTAEIAANGEKHEARLVRVIGAHLVSGSFPPANVSANLTIDDGSGPCTLRIDGRTDLAGQPTPNGRIDIVGIVGQFDATAPYNDGYQLLPRRRDDIGPTTTVSGDDARNVPQQFQLAQNHPNPFFITGETEIRFVLPKASVVRLEVFNLLGERVALLVDDELAAGENQAKWNGLNESGKAVTSGIYFYRLQAGSFMEVKKMVAVR